MKPTIFTLLLLLFISCRKENDSIPGEPATYQFKAILDPEKIGTSYGMQALDVSNSVLRKHLNNTYLQSGMDNNFFYGCYFHDSSITIYRNRYRSQDTLDITCRLPKPEEAHYGFTQAFMPQYPQLFILKVIKH